jgi:cell division septation protein DedD
MTRMVDPERPRDDHDYDDERFEDEGRRSIFSALWFRAILVVIVLGVVAAVAVPYVLELANQPAPKTATLAKPETPPMSAPAAPPAPPVASVPAPSAPAPEKSATPEKPSAADKPAASEGTVSAPTQMTPADKPAPPAAKKPESSKPVVASKSAAPREPAAARAPRAAAPSPKAASGDYFVQVGAFKNPDTAKKLAVRLREQQYNVEETSASGVKPARSASPSAPPTSAAASASDRYDVHVSGGAPADINAKLSAKGLSTEPSGAGVVVRPSMPLRDAVALSKDLAVDGLKVQVRRAPGGSAPTPAAASSAPAASSDGVLYRVRVGPFDDKSTATSTLRELEQKGYSAFIARGGQ